MLIHHLLRDPGAEPRCCGRACPRFCAFVTFCHRLGCYRKHRLLLEHLCVLVPCWALKGPPESPPHLALHTWGQEGLPVTKPEGG